MKCKRSKKASTLLACILFSFCLLIAFEAWKIFKFGVGKESSFYSLLTSLIGSMLFVFMIFYCSYSRILRINIRALPRHIVFFLPCLAVAINNFPLIPFFSGKAYVSAKGSEIVLWFLVCLGVGLFEELVFRGYIFMIILEKRQQSRRDVFGAVVLSSAIFGAVHLINIMGGSDPFATLLQVGYSFLVGGMCSIVLLKTGSIWYAVLLHTVYNFAGGVIPNLGGGVIWDAPTVAITVVLSVAVFAYLMVVLLKTDTKSLLLFLPNSGTPSEKSI